ncbi:CaiB/BaiF CoA transferase family protein [Desulfoferula mesophila]|uniref:Formyl-CoA transferase n=1 Tax=Desulfoferula mesophila TaxID=3058419 RepID=A0AAU9EJK8_9BACT|nr:formyl-CoA transferase [Desulfoferula mesophilus]
MSVFEKIKVLDMSHALAGPFAGMLLADFGAQVIKVEHPHGDHFRPLLGGAYHAAVNRNKRDISLDLKNPEAVGVVKKLMVESDVLIESFTPGAMDRLGLGYEAAREINPCLIYCSISGYGQTGPYHSLPGYDVVAQAMCGIMLCTGHADGPPVRIGASWIDMGAGMYTALAVLKALLERQDSGRGQRVDISLMDTALSWMSPLIARFSMSGELPVRAGSALAAFSPYQVFKAKDGYLFIGASTERFWLALCQMLGLEELTRDSRFATNQDRVDNREELTKLIEQALASRFRDEVVAGLRRAGIPGGPVLDVGQVLDDPHVQQRGVLHHLEHPDLGPLTQVKTPIAADGEMPLIKTPAPAVGQDTRQVLADLGYEDGEIERLLTSGAAAAPPS